MKEVFAKPAVGAIIEKLIGGKMHILVQQRNKDGGGVENGMIEIPAGKIREYENIFDAIRREVAEETGLKVTSVKGEEAAAVSDVNGYKTISFSPFCSTQNLSGGYSLLLQTFICSAEGEPAAMSDESTDIHWVSLEEIGDMLLNEAESFYPMHINALKKYLIFKA